MQLPSVDVCLPRTTRAMEIPGLHALLHLSTYDLLLSVKLIVLAAADLHT